MAKVLWISQLVENPVGSNMWEPKILSDLSPAFPPLPPIRWSTTDALRAFKFAAGRVDLTPQQLAAVEADTSVHVITESKWAERFNQQTTAFQNRVNTFCDNAGISRPTGNQIIKDFWTTVTQGIDNKTVDDLLRL